MAIINKKNNTGLKECRVYTPTIISENIYKIIEQSGIPTNVILDPSIGEGDLISPFKNYSKIIGVDIDKKGENYCNQFYNCDFEELQIDNTLKSVNLIISNPPFNGHPNRKLYPEVFLRKIIDTFGKDIPIVMIVPHGVRLNQKINSSRRKWMNENIKITSIMDLPLDIFPGVNFHAEVLFINIPNINPHYYLTPIENKTIPIVQNTDKKETTSKIAVKNGSKNESVLDLVSEKNEINDENFIQKDFKKSQQNILERGINLITKDLINNPLLSDSAYKNLSLIRYSRDKILLEKIEKLDDKEFLDLLKDKEFKVINSKSFNDSGDFNRFPLFVYAGGKQNHKSTQQKILSDMSEQCSQINSYYEPFAGGLGSVYNSLPILLTKGIKNIYVSDINPTVINAYRQVQKNFISVQRELSKIELDFYREFGKLYATTKEELKVFFEKKLKELNELEIKKRMNPKRAALFLYLMNICQGGMNNYDMTTKTNNFSCSFDGIKHKKIALIINKVEIYHQIFKLANFEFRVKRYQTVLKKIKNDNTAFVLLDPEYVEYGEEIIKSCRHTYTTEGKRFNHEEVLKLLNKGKNPFIYYNNHHSFIEKISIDKGYAYVKKEVEYTNGNKPKSSIEILMYGRAKQSSISTNNIGFNQNIKQVS